MNDLSYHKTLLKNYLQSPVRSHLILYGCNPNMKQLLFPYLDMGSYDQCRIVTYDKLTLKSMDHYHELDISQIQHKTNDKFTQLFEDIIYKDIYFKPYRYSILILDKFEFAKSSFQDKLRVLMESQSIYVKFILITKSYMRVASPLRSRCISLRIPYQQPVRYSSYKSPSQLLGQQLMKLYTHDFCSLTPRKIKTLKHIAQTIMKYNINIATFLQELLTYILQNPRWISSIKHNIIKLITSTDRDLIHSYRSVIHLESLFISLYYHLSAAHYEIHTDQ